MLDRFDQKSPRLCTLPTPWRGAGRRRKLLKKWAEGVHPSKNALDNQFPIIVKPVVPGFASEHRERAGRTALAVDEFQRRLLMHILTGGFQRIRYYGYLANCQRKEKLEYCRTILAAGITGLLPHAEQCRQTEESLTKPELKHRSPRCGNSTMVRIAVLAPIRWRASPPDTS
jgi:hypothetical protein